MNNNNNTVNSKRLYHPTFTEYSCDIHGNCYGKTGIMLSKSIQKQGYEQIGISVKAEEGRKGRGIAYLVHKFIFECRTQQHITDRKIVVSHLDNNPQNNNPSNLILQTQKQNIQDAFDQGRKFIPAGEDNCKAKLKESDVISIKAALKLLIPKSKTKNAVFQYIAEFYNVCTNTIRCIFLEKTWSHVKLEEV